MSFPRYQAYKSSGVEWLGDVPKHWQNQTLNSRFSIELGKMLDESRITGQHLVPYLRNVDVQWDAISFEDLPEMDITETEFDRYTVEKGDLLVCEGGEVGRAAIVADTPGRIGFQKALHRLRARDEGEAPKFMYYTLAWAAATGILNAGGSSTIAHLTGQQLRKCRFPKPPVEEQNQIVTFLNREILKIDALISEQQRLIELLREKRQAAIFHAVANGLNPSVPMKDSGIEWLGAVPKHWKVIPAKRVASIFVPQRNKPELNERGDGVFWATMDDVKGEAISKTDLWVSAEAAKAAGSKILQSHAVVASCVGSFGTASINSVNLIINQQLQAYIPNPSIKATFLRYCLCASKSYFEQVGTAATLVYVNQQGFENLPLPLPPLDEQENIVACLNRETAKLDALNAEAERAIALLQERRTALISAAVTGKIDVRGLAASQPTNEAAA